MATNTTQNHNALKQPIGPAIEGWTIREHPPASPMQGRYCRLEALDIQQHATNLYSAFAENDDDGNWTYLPVGPFESFAAFQHWLNKACCSDDPQFYAVIDPADGKAIGMAAYMRIDKANGSVEIGHVHFSPRLRNSVMATEAQYLMMQRAFEELGYRRYEWKCDALNEPSKRAAQRLGFQFEGIFRQAVIYKGRNRDTAWFSILDSEWPRQKQAFQAWLHPDNFDADGRQRRRLGEC